MKRKLKEGLNREKRQRKRESQKRIGYLEKEDKERREEGRRRRRNRDRR